ncbi:MAG: response regulator [Candidatus Omnitrophica bacterium]|nr:response regulator [Candidatus Omnitrophota bacterium]
MAKLLIVDDEFDVREFAANFFRKRKIDVSTASGGQEAIDHIKNNKPDLILLDINMKDINGIETLRRLKLMNEEINVIMVTGKKPEEEDAYQECKQLGAIDYIHKPLELDELERIVLNQLFKTKK